MELPTYTGIWRIEKRLYKLYDFRLPMPLPVGQIAVFVAITVPYVLLLTLFGSLLFMGTLAAPMFGVLSDRLGPRFILIVMRASYAGLAALLTLLALTGHLAPVWVFAVAALAGLVRPNDQALRNILVGETMPAPHLMGAVGLSRATMAMEPMRAPSEKLATR